MTSFNTLYNMSYITNKFQSIKLPNEPGMLEWLLENYPHSGYYIVEDNEPK